MRRFLIHQAEVDFFFRLFVKSFLLMSSRTSFLCRTNQIFFSHALKLRSLLYFFPCRYVKDRDLDLEDTRWIETQITNRKMSAEERYAFIKQHETLKKMVRNLEAKNKAQGTTGDSGQSLSPLESSSATVKRKIENLEAKVDHLVQEEEYSKSEK